jgi:hypothetical protein
VEHLDNAPARLVRVMAGLGHGQPVDVLGKVLAGPGETKLEVGEVARRLVDALTLTEEVELAVVRNLQDEEPDRVREVTDRCRALLQEALLNLRGTGTALDAIMAHDLNGWARKLKRRGTPQITTDSLLRLRSLLDEATAVLDDADDLDPAVAEFLREIVAVLARAVQDAMIRGPRVVDDALVHIAGLQQRYKDVAAQAEAGRSPAFKKVAAAVLAAIALLGPSADATLSITASVATLATVGAAPDAGPQPPDVVVINNQCGRPDDVQESGQGNGRAPSDTAVPHAG